MTNTTTITKEATRSYIADQGAVDLPPATTSYGIFEEIGIEIVPMVMEILPEWVVCTITIMQDKEAA